MATEKEIQKLVQAFEEMYKYYHGWHFAYEHPGAFVYHQMGGDLSVFFAPDWNQYGKVSIQVQDEESRVIESLEVPYSPPLRGIAYHETIEAHSLFRVVRPYLDARMEW